MSKYLIQAKRVASKRFPICSAPAHMLQLRLWGFGLRPVMKGWPAPRNSKLLSANASKKKKKKGFRALGPMGAQELTAQQIETNEEK